MKSKKAQTGFIIAGIFIFLIIAVIVVVLIIAVQKGKIFAPKPETDITPMKLYLQAIDKNSKELLDASYEIYSNKISISKGNLSKDSLTEIEVPRQTLEVYCYNKDHYLSKGYKIFIAQELIENSSKMYCPIEKIGNLKITHDGNLNGLENLIKFNITAIENWDKLSVTISWSPGIIDAYPAGGEKILCNNGAWKNYTYFNKTSKKYTWTPQTYYVCGQCENTICEISERCASVEGNKCTPFSTLIPNRFLGKVDKAIYFGKNLQDESYEVNFYVKTSENKNALDYVEFTFYDQDRRFDPSENMWRYMSEQNGINLGAEDLRYRINYVG